MVQIWSRGGHVPLGIEGNETLVLHHVDLSSTPRFRGGLVFKAHRLWVSHNSRLESNKEEEELHTWFGAPARSDTLHETAPFAPNVQCITPPPGWWLRVEG